MKIDSTDVADMARIQFALLYALEHGGPQITEIVKHVLPLAGRLERRMSVECEAEQLAAQAQMGAEATPCTPTHPERP